MPQTTPYTDAEMTDIRRYCGYPALSGIGLTYMYQTGVLDYALPRQTDAEQAVVRTTYLANLATLETAIPAAAGNLDTDQAAVWYRNKTEVAERVSLFDGWRRRLCQFIGIPPGPELRPAGQVIRT